LNNTITGNEANNLLQGSAGNDTLDGGSGIDTARYSGKLVDYGIGLAPNLSSASVITDKRINLPPSSSDGSDSVTNVERLQFSDVKLALDVGANQSAGRALLTMVATLGLGFAQQKDWAGAFLGYFDTGASVLDGASLLVSSGIMAGFAGGADNASLVRFVYTNIHGQAPSAAILAALVVPMDNHSITQAQWMADAILAADSQAVLAGYASSGWQYL
jgi:hypothetical protein